MPPGAAGVRLCGQRLREGKRAAHSSPCEDVSCPWSCGRAFRLICTKTKHTDQQNKRRRYVSMATTSVCIHPSPVLWIPPRSICPPSHHLLLTLFEPLFDISATFHRDPEPLQANGLPPTVPVSLLNNRITSRKIQLFCSQAENVQTVATMRAQFPPGKWHFASPKKNILPSRR